MSRWSVADVLDQLAPPTEEAVTGHAGARVNALAAHLPAELTRVVYLESWIGQLRPRLDLILKIERSDLDALAEFMGSASRPELRSAAWGHVASFARTWADSGSVLHEAIRAAWLEFDLDPLITPDEALRFPRVFVDFTSEAQRWPSIEARLELAGEVLWALSGSRPPQILQALRACLEHLPDGARLTYMGVFSREELPPVVRLCVVGLTGDLGAYLGAVGWTGDAAVLERSLLGPLARTQGEGAHLVGILHLDLAPDVCPRIGLEYTFPRPGLSGGLRSANEFLRQMVARGWCTARNRQSLSSWPRQFVELLGHDVWHSRVTRQIGHVKIIYSPGEPVVAKAYLRTAFELMAGGTLLHRRPRIFGAAASNRALAPFHSGGPPLAGASGAIASPQAQDRSVIHTYVIDGTAIALPKPRRGTAMTLSTAHQEALEQILTRAAADLDFRKALLADPRKTILDTLGLRIPANFRVKFIEREKDVDALIVLPDLQRQDGELDDDDLDAVAGGTTTDIGPSW